MKKSTFINLGLSSIVFLYSLTLMGQNIENFGNHGRKYPPTAPINTSGNSNGSANSDAAAGSISVAENTTYNTYNPTQLVQNMLITGCLTASNIRFGYYTKNGTTWTWNNHAWPTTAGDRQMAYFSKATSTFPINEGIILTTGKASSAMGPNNVGNKSDKMVSAASDPDLTSVSGKTMLDASVLEFDFVPAGNTVEFSFVFTSEEYIEYCETEFNDAFGFFLSGPGISGTYTNSAVNLATIPGNIPISINTIHPAGTNVNNATFPAENAQYYLDNPANSLTMQYDGGTVVMTATYPVVPCSTYRIKMAVADASDQSWDGAVFLQAKSFNSEPVTITNNNPDFGTTDFSNVFEGCSPMHLTFDRSGANLAEPLQVQMQYSGNATNGVDILTTSGNPLPSQITIPAGQTSYTIDYYAVADGLTEGAETFIVGTLQTCPCDPSAVYILKEIFIHETALTVTAQANNILCNGNTAGVITVNVLGGSGNYLFSLNSGTWQSSNFFTGLSQGTYSIAVKDVGSCMAPTSLSNVVLGAPSVIQANAGADVTICSGTTTQLNGSGGVKYSWTPRIGLSNYAIPNPIASPTATTTYTLTVTDANDICTSTDAVVVTVISSPTISVSPLNSEICAGTSLTLSASGGASYLWNPVGATTSAITVTPSSNSSYTVIGTAANGCTGTAIATVEVKPLPQNVSAGTDASIGLCQTYQLQGSATSSYGGTLTYQWSPSTGLSNSTIANPVFTPSVSGNSTYTLTVTDDNGCSASDQITISVATALNTSISGSTNVLCFGNSTGTATVSVNGGTTPYTYAWNTNPVQATATANGLAAGTYTVTVTDAKNCVSSSQIIITQPLATITFTSPVVTNISCSGSNDGKIIINATGGTGTITYSISPNVGSQSPSGTFINLPAQTYLITALDQNSCTKTFSVTVGTTTDVTAPVIVTCAPVQSAKANSNCQAAVPNFTANVTATDNCTAAASLTITQSPAAGTLVSTGVTTVTITVKDASNNSTTCNTTFTVTDNTAPVVVSCAPVQSANANANCQSAVPNFTANVTATDNCTAAASLTITQSPAAGTLVSTGVTTVTITVKDASNNSTTCNTTFTVTDNTAPVIVSCAPVQSANANANCQAAVPNFTANVTATDNCTTAASLTITQSPAAGTLVSTGVTTVTITVKDAANNSTNCNTTFTVTDNIAPVIVSCAPVQSANANANCQTAVPNFTTAVTATDNCTAAASLTITQSPAAGTLVSTGVTTVTITVKDASNNSATCNTTFTVTDNIAPVIVTCAPVQSANANANCQAAVPNFTANITAIDNCTAAASLTITQSPAAGTLVSTGVTTVTITVKDAANNSISCNTTFTVTDNIAPVIVSCAPVQSANANANCQAAVPNFTANVTATDNCTAAASLTITQSPAAGTLVSTGVTTVTITVKDASNNSTSCNTTFTVTDNIAPVVVTCAPVQSVNANANCQAAVPNFTTNVTATDNCTTAASLTITQSPAAGTLVSTGVTTVTITVKDASNNSTTCNTTFTVTDNTAPVIVSCAPVQSANANANCQAAVPNFTANVTATDNCTAAASLTITQSPAAGTLVSTGVTTVTITVKDASNNSTSCNTTFTVIDNIAPVVVTCAPVQSANANANCQAAVPNFTANITATDNCTAAASLTITQSPAAGTLVSTGVTTVTITIKDASNNSTSCNTTFTVIDNIAPVVVTCAPVQSANANANCQAAVPNFTANVTATDNCTAAASLTITQSPAAGTLVSTGVTTVTITVKDASNNSTTCNTTFTVNDNIAPVVVTCAPVQSANANANCQAAVPNFTANVTATDNCTVAASLTITQSPAAGTLVSTGVTTVTITVKDASNNTTTCNTTFTVTDNLSPTISGPENVTVFADLGQCYATSVDLGIPTTNDNCGIATVNNNAPVQFPIGSTTVNWTVIDLSGLTATSSQTVTVSDNQIPTIICPAAINVNANTGLPYATGVNLGNPITSDNCGVASVSNDAPIQFPVGSTIVTWTVIDVNGLSSSCTQIVNVSDNQAPTMNCPASIPVSCINDVPAAYNNLAAYIAAGGTVVDNDEINASSFSLVSQTSNGLTCPEVITRVYTVADVNNNFGTCSQLIIVDDEIAPEFINFPADVTASCSNVPAIALIGSDVTSSDNCDLSITITFENEVKTNGTCAGSYTLNRTWKAVDDCGNITTKSQIITVQDITAPVLAGQGVATTISCPATPEFTAPTASDNCDANSAITFTDAAVAGTCAGTYTITRTWIATDVCGNISLPVSQAITVQDITAPVLAGQGAAATINCPATPEFTAPTATDNCDIASVITFTDATVAGTCAGTYTTTRTWIATDVCGNVSLPVSQAIIVQDITAPVLAGQGAAGTINCPATPEFTAPTATDNCDIASVITFTDATVDGTCAGTYTTTRTWVATDVCGNISLPVSQAITVQDITAPVLAGQGAAATINCPATPEFTAPTATDNCDIASVITFTDATVNGTCAGTYTTTRTWIATDVCGNISLPVSLAITVQDITAPVLAGQGAAATINCPATPEFTAPTATDNCDANSVITFTDATVAGLCVGTYTTTRTWIATDVCGNVSLPVSQAITVQDITAPVLAGQGAAATINCPATSEFTTPTATDNCDANSVITFTDATVNGICAGTYTTTRTWIAIDVCGNVSLPVSQAITVQDITAPVLAGQGAAATINCPATPEFTAPTATDNCDVNSVITFTDATVAGTCAGTYTTTRTWIATDVCGNVSLPVSQAITVQDITAPEISCPASLVIQTDAGLNTSTVNISEPIVTDNCSIVTFSNNFNNTNNASGIYPLGLTTVIWTATDACGNTNSCQMTVTVTDNESPSMNCPSAISVNCIDEMPDAYISLDQFITAGGYATDNTGINASSFNLVNQTSDNLTCPETISRVYGISDNDGNIITCTQLILIDDITAPVLAGQGAAATINCPATPEFTAPTATDNCDIASVITFTDATVAGSCAGTYTITRTWIATDVCGNISLPVSQAITVQDITAPVLTGQGAAATINCPATPEFTAPAATDNCDANSVITFTDATVNGTCAGTYTTTRTWIATDACGNISLPVSQAITVQDITAPVLTGQGAAATINCPATPEFTAPAATDNCDANSVITFTDATVNGTCAGTYTTTRTWIATDACGNVSLPVSQAITVQDITAPVLAGQGAAATINCPASPEFTAPIASDNCDANSVITFTDATVAGTCAGTYTTTRTWIATDVCGNISLPVSQAITVQDITAPVLAGQGAAATINCPATPEFTAPTPTDNCDANSVITFTDATVAGTCSGTYTTTRTWVATDVCGNVSLPVSQAITVQDVTAPVLAGQGAAATINCPATPEFTAPTPTDNCDATSVITFTDSTVAGTCAGTYTTTRTWIATDACGNISLPVSQAITVQDITAPVLAGQGAAATINCPASPEFTAPTPTDNCDANSVITFTDATVAGTCAGTYTITRTWVATDVCGNVSLPISQAITVQDITAPVLTGQGAAATINCPAIPEFTAPTASDNCDANSVITFTDATVVGTCAGTYTTTRTWIATDVCGNISLPVSQAITVQDITAPVLAGQGAAATINCPATPEFTAPTATDNCDANSVITFTDATVAGTCSGTYTITRTWIATDVCGNISLPVSQAITVQDITAPVLNGQGAAATINCPATPEFTAPTVTDNCDANSVITFTDATVAGTCAGTYTTTRTWVATDVCGNISLPVSQAITVQDITAPVLAGQGAAATINCPATPEFTAPTATDNCDIASVITFTDATVAGTCAGTYTSTRTWIATDVCGNISLPVSQAITVQDITAPVLAGQGAAATINCPATPEFTAPTPTDNCDANSVITFTDATVAGTCSGTYTTTRTWVATDVCGNVSLPVSKAITVQDVTAPVLAGQGAAATINCPASPEFTAPTPTDNCDANSVITFTDATVAGTCSGTYTITRTWIATDVCGNVSLPVSQAITVQDVTAPVLAGQGAAATINCPASPEFTAPTPTDNCDANSVITFTDATVTGTCSGTYTITRTWVATDVCGNVSLPVSQAITVQDITAPVVTCPSNITVNNDPGVCGAIVVIPQPTIVENCSNVTISNSINQTSNASGLYPVGTTIIDWTVSDECGNTSTCSMSITIIDNEAPVITCPEDILICSTEQLVLISATGNDNCGEVIISSNAPSTFEPGTTLVVWTATDIHGITTSCTQTVTITPMVIVNAGTDEITCAGQSFTINSASALNYSSVLWTTTGQGTIQNATNLNPTYVPVAAETGNVYLTLTAYGLIPCASVQDQMLLTILPSPIAMAGPDASICANQTFTTADAYAGYTGSILWTTNGTGTFTEPTQAITTYIPGSSDITNGSVVLMLTSSGTPPCSNAFDSLILTINNVSAANAGIDESSCQDIPYTFTDATATNYNSVNWIHDGAGTLTGANTLAPTYTPAAGETGVITFTLTAESNSSCGNSSDIKKLTIFAAPTAFAGSDFESCGTSSIYLGSANVSGATSANWTSSGTGTFDNTSLVNATYTPSLADVDNGSVTLLLTVNGNQPCGTAIDEIIVTLAQGTQVFAGENTSICSNTSYLVNDATVNGATSVSWTHNGQGLLENAGTINPTYIPATGESGTVTLFVTATGQLVCGSVTDSLLLEVVASASAFAGNDISSCLLTPVGISGAQVSNSTSLLWSTSGTGIFDDASLLHPVYTPSQADFNSGFVVITLQANGSSPCGHSNDSVRIDFIQAPVANAGLNQPVCGTEQFTFSTATANNYSSVSWTHNGLGNLNNPALLNPTYTPAEGETGDIVFTLTANGSSVCGNMMISDEVILTYHPTIILNAGFDEDIASGTSTTLHGEATGGSGVFSYNWSPEAYLVDNTVLQPTTLALNSETTFTLTLLDMTSGCSESDNVTITLGGIMRPVANDDYDTTGLNSSTLINILQNDSDPVGLGLNVTITSHPKNGTAILFEDGSLTYTPATNFSGNDTITYLISDKGTPSKVDSAQVIITIFPIREDIEIYNLVTPNGDGKNDFWYIRGISEYPDNEVFIFNRWGDKLIEINNYDNAGNSWNGKNEKNEYLPDGVYYYILKIKDLKTYTGWIYVRGKGDN